MVRNKWQVCRDSGLLPHKRDTPVKLGRRAKHRRPMITNHYETLPEEPEEEEVLVPTVKTTSRISIKPAKCKPALNPRDAFIFPATPAGKISGYQASPVGHPTIQMTADTEVLKGGEILAEDQNLTVTPESIISSSVESDPTYNSDDDEEDSYSSASSSSSSLPSPEIFRRENDAETVTFPTKVEHLGLFLNIKNSTLLDVSHAQSIHMHQPPNLSAIADASMILAEKCDMSNNRAPAAETEKQTDAFESDKEIERKTLKSQLIKKRPILCKKKVIFKSPIVAEILEKKHSPAFNCSIHYTCEPVQTSSPADQMKPDAEASTAGAMNSKEDASHLRVTLKKPVKSSPEKAKFFHFASDDDEDVFFQTMRESLSFS